MINQLHNISVYGSQFQILKCLTVKSPEKIKHCFGFQGFGFESMGKYMGINTWEKMGLLEVKQLPEEAIFEELLSLVGRHKPWAKKGTAFHKVIANRLAFLTEPILS